MQFCLGLVGKTREACDAPLLVTPRSFWTRQAEAFNTCRTGESGVLLRFESFS